MGGGERSGAGERRGGRGSGGALGVQGRSEKEARVCAVGRLEAGRTSGLDAGLVGVLGGICADFLGQGRGALVEPAFVACAVRPAPPQ